MSSAPDDLDNPLYGDFEDYLDGKLPPARHREVADLLARSAAAREALEELRIARKWLERTHWDVPEPAKWPSAEEILARAGWRPAASLSEAAKPDRSAGRAAGWLAGWMSWRWNLYSPAWALGAAAGVLLLVGGGLWWWGLSPSALDELAQSRVSEASEPPARSERPELVPARPDGSAYPAQPGQAAPFGTTPQEKGVVASAPEARSPEEKSKRLGPPSGVTGVKEGSQGAKASSAPLLLAAPAGEPAGQARVAAAPLAADSAVDEAVSAEQREARPLAAAPLPKAGASPRVAGHPSSAGTAERSRADRGHDGMKKASEGELGLAADAQEVAAPVTALTLYLVVANRRAALAQVATVVRELGGTVQRNGEQVVVMVPAGHVADCAARLRARVSVATEGETLQVTIRGRE